MIGTLINAGAIIAGSAVGILVNSRLPEKVVKIVFQGIGLFTVAIGISMSLSSDNIILIIVSIVSGAIIGETIDIEKYLKRFSDFLQRKTSKNSGASEVYGASQLSNTAESFQISETSHSSKNSSDRFSEGFVTASMLFCVGSMSILGAIEDGMGNTPNLLFAKSIMDGISSIALASSFGVAIAFSAVPLLIYQGGITLFAGFIMRFMSDAMIADLTSVGGILLIGLGITILKIKEIKVTNMLPSLLIIVILSYFFS